MPEDKQPNLQEIRNGLGNSTNSALWIILYLALGGGLGGGVFTIASTQDRYTAADASRDLQIRDERIAGIVRRVEALERQVQKIDDTHPPPQLVADVQRLKEEVHDIQLEQARRSK